MKFVPFDVDASLREMTRHGSDDFPVAIYLRRMNDAREGNLILHWHEELQFVIPLSGPILFTVCDEPYVLSPGTCLFINSRSLHMAKPMDTQGGAYICVDIHPQFLSGYGSSLIGRNYVQPFLSPDAFPALLLDGAQPWHGDACALLEQLVRIYDEKDYAYELAIQKIALELWLLIIRNHREKSAARRLISQGDQDRLDRILSYIQSHYGEKITLNDIAGASNLSISECCRFVRRTLGLSPMTYLNNFRIVKSANLLQTTDMTITEIAQAVGFGSSSYYTDRFKKMMNCKPLEYRRKATSGQPL